MLSRVSAHLSSFSLHGVSTERQFVFGALTAKFCVRAKPVSRRNVTDSYVKQEVYMLWTVLVVLLILWLLGFSLHIGGGLIHLLLVVGLVVLIINLLSGRRTAE